MCGIFGAAFLAAGDAVDVDAALASIRHRGPDRNGVYRSPAGDALLGFVRLAILDLSPAGDQPMVSTDGKIALVFNGEIYNHHELRSELEAKGRVFRSRSDTEVILEGYAAWGDDVVAKLDGMFAIGIWDVNERRLLLARDRSGKKPLFYARLPNGSIRFGSEAKAIVASGFEAHVNERALPSLFALGYTLPDESIYRGIAQLPPASYAVIEDGRDVVVKRYWRAPFAAPPLDVTYEDAKKEVRRLVDAAVARRLEADVPIGAFLSGGIDSTVVVGAMSRAMTSRVKSFSIGFSGDARFDETHYARIAARAFNTEHVEFTLQPSSFDLVEQLVRAHDGPFGDSSAIPVSVVSMLTREHVTVALTGDGGDEIFCGYTRFLAAEAAERIPSPLRSIGGAIASALPRGESERTLRARAHRFLSKASLPLADRLVAWSPYFASSLDRLLRPEIAARTSLEAPWEWNRAVMDRFEGASVIARILGHNFETYLPEDLLVKSDRASMLHSLEVRSPFLDTKLVEFVARLPDSFKRRGRQMKRILKDAYADILPPEILTRGKMGFGVPLGAWFRSDLKNHLIERLGRDAKIYAYVDFEFVQSLLREHFDARADHAHRLWLLLTFEVWLASLSG